MPIDSGIDVSGQFEQAARRVQEIQDRALQMSLRQAESFDRQMSATRMLMDRAAGLTGMAAGASLAAARSAGGTVGVGFGYGFEHLRRATPQIAHAVGMGGGPFGGGAASRGWEGPYYGGTQTFGGLLYEAGIGAALRSAFSFLPGQPFGDVNQVVGATPAMVGQRARDELALRVKEVGFGALTALPFSNRLGFDVAAIGPDLRRQLARQLSFVAGGDAAGGRGFRATGQTVTGMNDAIIADLQRLNRSMGYGLSDADRDTLAAGWSSGMNAAEMERASRLSPQEFSRKFGTRVSSMKHVADLMRVSSEQVVEFYKAVGEIFDAGDVQGHLTALGGRFSGGAPGPMSSAQRLSLFTGGARAAAASGASGGFAASIGMTRLSMADAIYVDMRRGALDKTAMSVYGSTIEEQQANLSAARMQAGLNFGFSSPGMAALYAGNPVAARRFEAGGYDLLGGAQAMGGTILRDPAASLRARFDPTAQEAMKRGGRYAAFAKARQVQDAFARLGFSDTEAFGINEFGRRTGLDDTQAALQFRQHVADLQEAARVNVTAEDQLGVVRLRESLRLYNPNVSISEAADAYRRANKDGIKLNEAPELMASYVGGMRTPTELAEVRAQLTRPTGPYMTPVDGPNMYSVYGANDRGAFRRHNDPGRYAGFVRNQGTGSVGMDVRDVNAMVAKLRAGGVSIDTINRRIAAQAFGGMYSVSADGKLQRKDKAGAWAPIDEADAIGNTWADRFEGVAVYGGLRSASEGMPDAQAREAAFLMSGGGGAYLLRGVGGASFDDRLSNLLEGSGASLTPEQRDLRSLFASDGKRLSGEIFSRDAEEARRLVRMRYMREHANESDAAGKAQKLADSVKTREDFERHVNSGDAAVQDALRGQVALSYESRRHASLAAADAMTRGTHGNPMITKVVP